ncbi:GNAT family N-acetyltransferase [Pseudomonas sp. X10]
MHIRLTLPADIPLLPAIERSAARAFERIPGLAWLSDDSVMNEAQHLAFLQTGCSWVVADGQDRPVGFLCARRVGRELHIHELSVRQEAQGQGLGRRLLAEAVTWARQQGLTALTLTTFADVPWNAPFYARFGFQSLDARQLDERLYAILDEERRHGLDGRCAMRLTLG